MEQRSKDLSLRELATADFLSNPQEYFRLAAVCGLFRFNHKPLSPASQAQKSFLNRFTPC
jgi:hypothetical protein